MPDDKKISELPLATTPLAGTEELEIVQGGVNKRVATSDVGGGGSVQSVTGDGVDNTDPANPVINNVNSAIALTDAASMDLTAIKHTLTTASATRTFTISYTGDDITLEIILNATASTLTFPATSLCVSEGVASGDNTCALAGASGDIYMIAIKKIGSNYRVVAKNFGQ